MSTVALNAEEDGYWMGGSKTLKVIMAASFARDLDDLNNHGTVPDRINQSQLQRCNEQSISTRANLLDLVPNEPHPLPKG